MAKYNLYSADLSRRYVLLEATSVAAGAAMVVAASRPANAAKAKRSQADVAYQDRPKGDERCDNCEPWIPPNGCRTVEGEVAAKGWCKIWVAK